MLSVGNCEQRNDTTWVVSIIGENPYDPRGHPTTVYHAFGDTKEQAQKHARLIVENAAEVERLRAALLEGEQITLLHRKIRWACERLEVDFRLTVKEQRRTAKQLRAALKEH